MNSNNKRRMQDDKKIEEVHKRRKLIMDYIDLTTDDELEAHGMTPDTDEISLPSLESEDLELEIAGCFQSHSDVESISSSSDDDDDDGSNPFMCQLCLMEIRTQFETPYQCTSCSKVYCSICASRAANFK